MNTKILAEVGLTGNEIKIYLALLKLGSVTAGEILKKIELHRGAVYDTLDKLIDKGLVSYVIKANRKYFEAANAKNFMDVIEKKEEKIQQEKEEILQLIPQLEEKRTLGKAPQEVTLYKGNKGLKSIFQDWLEEKKEVLVIGAYAESAESLKYHMKYSLPGFHNKRIKQKQMMKFIFPKHSILRAKQVKEYKYTSVKVLSAPFDSMTSIQVYGDKVATIMWSSEPIGIVVRSKEIAKSYKDYFKVLWEMGKVI
jgi:HTH-type transcriptional regulator, sugar sensing transcriptional regulator